MQDDINNKPLTIQDIREVLIPAMEGVFATKKDLRAMESVFATKQDLQAMQEVFATKKDLQAMQEVFATKQDLQDLKAELTQEIQEKFDKIMTSSDRIIKDLEILMTEKAVGYHQRKKEQQLWSIVLDALREHKILSSDQLAKINKLEVF